jgi:S1-C subfamily serine protease
MKRLPAFVILAVVLVGGPAESAGRVACDKSFADVFEAVAPSVVRVFSVTIDPFNVTQRVQLRVGSGVVIDGKGRVVTNAHIVHDARVVMVGLDQQSMQKAKVVGIDLVSDLAVILPTTGLDRYRPAPLGRSSKLRTGQEVLAIGHPLGMGKAATRGIVSGVGRVLPVSPLSWMTPFVQTDAAISPGNSGGPLVSRCGQVVAINTLAGRVGQNINFAIPIDLVRRLVPQLVSKGRVVRAWHGIRGGLRGGSFPVVIGVRQYLLGGDVIAKVNGKQLTSMSTIFRIVKSLRVGSKVKLEVWRGSLMKTFEVVLTERPVLPGDIKRFQLQGARR